ncbi:N-acetylglucosaminyl transferase component Gpi1 [Saccharata proteae CBS 121410]|uniref:N-acetylglucosaminyl transferase component Gpi1 n=1 Tax=Saccharata proteae CBS 121410 TaxID=1314787 RepID=A0A9P4HS12_9PEZI|nr:N-acetylglucosaminyl transferase component Gpi1 [Saccharata proteae CBS 121410]
MHPFSVLTLGIFVAGYITARWDLVTRLYELAIFAWDHGVVTRAAKGFAILSLAFFFFVLPIERIAARETDLVSVASLVPSRNRTAADTSCRNVDMVTNNGLMRIFWPSDTPKTPSSGVLVGWRNSEFDIFVVTVLQDIEPRRVDNALRVGTLFRNSPYPMDYILDRCGHASIQVLGSLNPQEPPTSFNPSSLVAYTSTSSRFPELYCPQDSGLTVQVILFDRPNPTRMQYLSLTQMSLALADKPEKAGKGIPPLDGIDAEEEQERMRKQKLVEKLKMHTVVKHVPTQKELSLPEIVDQANCCYEIAELLHKNRGLIGTRTKRALSVSERVVESATTLWDYIWVALWHILYVWIYPVAAQLFILGLIAHRIAGELILRVLDWRLLPHSAALKDVSATAQQVDIRLQQFCYWPIQYLTLRRRKSNWQSITSSHPEYIRFYNSLWLVANDVIIGIALGSYIIENADFVASQVDVVLTAWSIEGLRRMISWLMDWPAGLKLNNELAAFLGDLFLWVIDYWADCMTTLRPALPVIIHFIGFSSFAGATMPISLFSDLVSVLTLHIYSFYVASARIFNWQLTIIFSLFHLFRGKKRNVLRNRIDSCDYDLDQLLLGTILFTLLFFLIPTVLVFYLTFASARMAIITLKAILDTLLACLNHFPLFALMLRIKDSRRLPGGIRFDLHDTRSAKLPEQPNSAPTSYIILKSVPLPLRAMFNEYFQLGNRIRKHYISPGVFLCLVTGRFVPPIHRKNLYSLQYSMLPARRAGIAELWMRLTENRCSGLEL